MGVRLGTEPAPPRARCNRLYLYSDEWFICRRLTGHRGRHARRLTFLERFLRLV